MLINGIKLVQKAIKEGVNKDNHKGFFSPNLKSLRACHQSSYPFTLA
jgi:hypothetical protein